jgi:hypothetical protein
MHAIRRWGYWGPSADAGLSTAIFIGCLRITPASLTMLKRGRKNWRGKLLELIRRKSMRFDSILYYYINPGEVTRHRALI